MTAALEFLGWRGIVGLVGMIALAVLFGVQKMETRHWHKQSDQFEALYHSEQAAHAKTVANYRAAAEQARAADKANAERVIAEQKAINERTTKDYEARIADARARARAERLRGQPAPTNPGSPGAAPVPAVPAGPRGPDGPAAQGGLPAGDALIATEQAIQLDELQRWVKSQTAVDNSRPSPTGSR